MQSKNIKFIIILFLTALFLTGCGGRKMPEGVELPVSPPNPELMQPTHPPIN